MILVKTEAEALDLRARIQKRESFEELARKYSIDSSASAGGFLGVLNLTDLRKEFQNGLSGLHPGEIGPIVKVSEGYALLQLLTETESRWQTQNDAALRALEQGQFREAEVSLLAAIREAEHFGSLDARLASSLNNLAEVYHAQKNYAAAEPLHKRALAIREKVLGPEHLDVSVSLNNLAGLYQDQKNYSAAEPLYKRALAVKEKTLGPDNPDVGASLINLAALYRDQGNTEAAEPLYKRALAIAEKAFGPEDPNVVASLINLAGLYHDEEKYSAAEPLYKRALAIQENVTNLVSMAELYQDQENYAAAEPLYKRALAIDEKTFGPDHPNVGMSLFNLALLEENLENYAAAELLLRRALVIYEKTFGPDNPIVKATRDELTGVLRKMGR